MVMLSMVQDDSSSVVRMMAAVFIALSQIVGGFVVGIVIAFIDAFD